MDITSSLLGTCFSSSVLLDFWEEFLELRDDFLEPWDCDKAFFAGDFSVNSFASFTTYSRRFERSVSLLLRPELQSNVGIPLNRENYITLRFIKCFVAVKMTCFMFLHTKEVSQKWVANPNWSNMMQTMMFSLHINWCLNGPSRREHAVFHSPWGWFCGFPWGPSYWSSIHILCELGLGFLPIPRASTLLLLLRWLVDREAQLINFNQLHFRENRLLSRPIWSEKLNLFSSKKATL